MQKNYKLEKNMNQSILPGGKYAILRAEHTAETIRQAWSDIFSVWLPDSGYQIDNRPIFEKYTGPSLDVRIEPDVCEICIPVKAL